MNIQNRAIKGLIVGNVEKYAEFRFSAILRQASGEYSLIACWFSKAKFQLKNPN